jgi:hypothetical protein
MMIKTSSARLRAQKLNGGLCGKQAVLLLFTMAIAFSFASWPAWAGREEERKAKITWRKIDGAAKYEIELALTSEMDPLLQHKEVDSTGVEFFLKSGSYYFRVRGVDSTDAPGPWSQVEGFVVNPGPPSLLEPKVNQVFDKELFEPGIVLKWTKGVRGSESILQIDDEKGTIVKRRVNDAELSWMPLKAGTHRWRVGFETPTGIEWSKFYSFVVGEGAFKKPEPPKVIVKQAEMSAEMKSYMEAIKAEGGSDARGSDWWIIGRGAEAVVAYTTDDKDLKSKSAGAALVTVFSSELRWRGGKSKNQVWTWSGSLNLEVIRETILGATSTLPRGYARVFYGKESGLWRAGPFLQVQGGQSGIFLIESPTKSRSGKVSRTGVGAGGVVVYRPAPTLGLSGLALMRVDSGGESSVLPNPLLSSLAFEAGFGMVFSLSSSMMIEGRLRALQENYQWAPASGGAEMSSIGNTFIIFDLGLGVRF